MPHKWQMRMAGALPVGMDVSSCSWCFVKLGSSVEIARPVVVSEKGDSRVSRKWERLALRGSMVVLCAWALVGGVQKGAVGVCAVRRRQVRCGVFGFSWPCFTRRTTDSTAVGFERSSATSQHFNAVAAASSRLLSGG